MENKLIKALSSGSNTLLLIDATDLQEFAKICVCKTIDALEQRNKAGLPAKEFLTANEVCDIVGVSMPTLWRWAKAGYLLPIMVGAGKCKIRKFRTMDIKRILQQR